MDLAQKAQELQTLLEGITPNVYHQAPTNTAMVYPCVLFERDSIDKQYADDVAYATTTRYKVTVIDPDPDSPIAGAVVELPLCGHDRSYAAEDLNHDVFTLYF